MMGRLRYYYSKTQRFKQKHGWGGTLAAFFSFLKRRQFFLQFFFEWFEYHVISKSRSLPATVIRELKVTPRTGPKVLIYASYDSGSVIRPQVIQQVSFFKSQSYDVIFVSTSPEIPASEFAKIAPYVDIAVHRKNEGYDFASWATGFLFLNEPHSLSSFVLMNDSCLGPEYDFSPQLLQMETSGEVVYGLTKCYEIAEYLQSYFYHFGSEVIRAQVLAGFMNRIRILHSKWAIVRYFEIGGSAYLKKRGISLNALVDPADEEVGKLMKLNAQTEPTARPLGKEWVRSGKSPFFKRSHYG